MPLDSNELKKRFPAEDAHYEFLKGLSSQEQWTVKYLYDRLNIIDSKTGAMLRVNSTIIAFLGAIVVLLARSDSIPSHDLRSFILVWIIVNLIVLASSDLLSLRGIFWLRFDHIANAADFDRYRLRFCEVTALREKRLRTVIILSFIGELGFVVLFLILACFEIAQEPPHTGAQPTSSVSAPTTKH
jgi:hypothetical protein